MVCCKSGKVKNDFSGYQDWCYAIYYENDGLSPGKRDNRNDKLNVAMVRCDIILCTST